MRVHTSRRHAPHIQAGGASSAYLSVPTHEVSKGWRCTHPWSQHSTAQLASASKPVPASNQDTLYQWPPHRQAHLCAPVQSPHTPCSFTPVPWPQHGTITCVLSCYSSSGTACRARCLQPAAAAPEVPSIHAYDVSLCSMINTARVPWTARRAWHVHMVCHPERSTGTCDAWARTAAQSDGCCTCTDAQLRCELATHTCTLPTDHFV